jgi:mannose-6-phosphate isomerase-like protein (cupin superfamily)
LQTIAGFRSYVIVDTGNGTGASIGMLDNKEAAENANQQARGVDQRTALWFLEGGMQMIRSRLTPLALVLPLLRLQAVAAEGRTASYHKHSIDFVYCWVEAAQIRTQVLGLDPTEPKNPSGTVVYNGYTKTPVVHQVSNVDNKPFHVVGFEIMYPSAGRFSPSNRSDVPDYKVVLDNERVRGWRLVLEPGQSVAAITQKAPGVRIVLSGGGIVESEPGHPDQDMDIKLGDFIWQDPDATRSVSNTGSTRVEFVEFELK